MKERAQARDPRHPAAPAGNQTAAPAGAADSVLRGRRLLALAIFLFVAAVFMPALSHDFVTYDDPTYVTQNPHVVSGLSWTNVRWAFQATEASNWHPLTWLSHMADAQVFGLRPWGHHLTSVLLHALNAALLFSALVLMTGAVWRSALVAVLFGIHPLHVESVAWIAERKDVLSTLFLMLVLWAYTRRIRCPAAQKGKRWTFYGLALTFFALGLMAKPMLVTLPFVLLLLDYWPLRRWAGATTATRFLLVAEKIPFFALSAASCAATLYAQGKGGALASVETFPWGIRIANALTSYCWYLEKLFVPAKLAVFYPFFASRPPLAAEIGCAVFLSALTALSVALARRQPSLLVGWLWFLGTLVPVIGLVQIGGQSMADRYSYVPSIGIFIMAAWALPDGSVLSVSGRRLLSAAGGALVLALTVATVHQLAFWANGIRLFRHALAVTQDNWVAHANLAASLSRTSDAEASEEFRQTLQILARFAETYNRKGVDLEKTPGRLPEAIKTFRIAIQIFPEMADSHYNLGTALARTAGGLPEAVEEFRTATKLRPDYLNAHFNLATALAKIPGGDDEAIAEYRLILSRAPNDYLAHFFLGQVLARTPTTRGQALAEFRMALLLQPDFKPAEEMLQRYGTP
jgi:tetratricopeptide (TPR) repeat protein